MPDCTSNASMQVLVCQNTTCRKQGAARILAELQTALDPNSEIRVTGCGCLGQCGNGPMMLVLPEQIWYSHVAPEDIAVIVAQHLQQGQPVTPMLYRKFHPLH